MKEFQIKSEAIKDYLLGRVSDEKLLVEIEDLLFSDDEFCDQVELVEDQLINDYSFGKLNEKDKRDFEKSLENNPERISKVEFAALIKEKAKVEKNEAEEKSSFFDSIKAFLSQPLYAGAFGVLLVAILFSAFYFLLPNNNDELASLKDLYKNERPITSRVSDFEYAPYVAERSETTDEANINKLRLIENNLLEAVEENENAATLHALGVFYLTQKKYDNAIRNLKKAVELEDKNAKYRNDLGTAYFEFAKNGKPEKRLENFARANEEFTKAFEQNPQLHEALFNKALVLEELNLPKQAEESWKKYLELDKTSKWSEEARKNLERLKNKESAFKTYEQILDEFLDAYRADDEKRFWKIHLETKGVFTGVSIHQQLTRKYLESLEQHKDEESKEYLTALEKIGELEIERHADFFFKDLAEYYSNIRDEQISELLTAKKLIAEGVGLVRTTKYTESIEKFEKSQQIFLAMGNKAESYISKVWIGEMLPDVNKNEQSKVVLNSIIEESNINKYKIFIPISYIWLGFNEFRKSEYSEGIKVSKQGLESAKETENIFQIAYIVTGILEIYIELGEIQTSQIYVDQSTQQKNLTYANRSQVWRNLSYSSLFFQSAGYDSTAVDAGKEALEFSLENLPDSIAVNNSLNNLIRALSKQERFAEAIEYADRSNEIAVKRGETDENLRPIADSFYSRGNLKFLKKDCHSALDDFEKSLAYNEKIPETTYNLFNVHKGKLLCFESLGQKENFEKELELVLDLSEKSRQKIREDDLRQTFYESVQIVYDAAIKNALENNDELRAFELSETSKARSLLDFVRSDESISDLENNFSQVTQSLKTKEIQAKMPDNVRILQYALLENSLLVWILTKDSLELVETKIEKSILKAKINEYRKAIISKEKSEKLDQMAIELYQILIPKNIPNDKVLALVPDKSLNKIPFASLRSPEGNYLIEKFRILQSPSSSVFIYATEKANKLTKNSTERLLVFGNPRFDRTENPNLEDLPGAELEAEKISSNYPARQIFVGEKALKQSFTDNFQNAGIIHFAGHFVSNEQSKQNSKLIFADESLRVYELSEKKLTKTKLVVLSACETGFENLSNNEGAIGIARTFLALGSPLVVSSLWKVDSEATKDLMISFHQKRRNGNLTSIEALRRTQLEMMKTKNFSHPFFWSAFVVTGGLANY